MSGLTIAMIRRFGYPAYLVAKIAKALSLPVWLAGWLAYAALWSVLLVTLRALAGVREAVTCVAGDCGEYIIGRKWFTGFSRAYFHSLSHYKPAPFALPPEETRNER